MKIFSGVLIKMLPVALLAFAPYAVSAQDYPFQNTKLSDDERLDNLISLMTLDEKINHLSPMLPGIPRLGVKGTRIVEGLHGLALSVSQLLGQSEGPGCRR